MNHTNDYKHNSSTMGFILNKNAKKSFKTVVSKISILMLFIGLTISFTSCENDDHPNHNDEPENMEETLDISSANQQLIYDARMSNNLAIAMHDAASVAEDYRDNFFILTSTNGFFEGQEEVQGIYQSVFDSRDEVVFERLPTKISVNDDWSMASENGKWTGTWNVEGEQIEVGGDYYAKWHKMEDGWKLRSEVYTQFDCSGMGVCDNKPVL